MAASDDETATSVPTVHTTTVPDRRPWRRSIVVGVVVGLAVAGIVYLLIAMPLYFLASLEANGRDRPIVRTGLLVVGPAVSLSLGVVAGLVGGRWYRSGRAWVDRSGSRGDRFVV